MENLVILREAFHYFLHLVFPVFIAKVFFRKDWRKAYFIMLATMLVDLDHLLANPIFDANRNSIGFHPLHTYPMIALYFLGSIFLRGNFRIIAIGLFVHMLTDFQDYFVWKQMLKIY